MFPKDLIGAGLSRGTHEVAQRHSFDPGGAFQPCLAVWADPDL